MKNALQFGLHLFWCRLTYTNAPFLVQFTITNRCNLQCRYCYSSYYQRPSDDMPLAQVQKLVDILAKAGIFRLNIVGGEPLVRQDIGEVIEYVIAKGIHCAITTNGALVPQKIGILRKLDTVCVSIDGKPENNDQLRGAGAFDKAVLGLRACKEAGIPIQISAVLTKYTVADVEFMVALARQYNCKVGFTTLINQQGQNSCNESAWFPENQEVRNALTQIIKLKQAKSPILFSARAYEYALAWPDYRRGIITGENPPFCYVPCYAGRYFCIIDYNGDLYPCPQLVGMIKPGNVLQDGIKIAMQKASSHQCKACSMPCSNEFSMFFGFSPQVLFDQFHGWRDRCR